MSALRVLITNMRLVGRSGTELFAADLARSLVRQGHLPTIYSPLVGELGRQLREESIPVVDALDSITEAPDIVHGHHILETLSALLHFGDTPGIFVGHDCSGWHDRTPLLDRIRRYVAVDYACRERMTQRDGIPPERIEVIYNGVDQQRFRPRPALPPRPHRALLLSNYADVRTLQTVKSACEATHVQLDCAGVKLGGVAAAPHELLPSYDLVFAKGRCAWEALTVGNAVIVCDATRMGSLVTDAQLDELSRWNFGRRTLQVPLTPAALSAEIRRYDAADATRVAGRVRALSSLEMRQRQWVELYETVLEEQRGAVTDWHREARQLAHLLHWWSAEREELVRQQAKRYGWTAVVGRLYRSLLKRCILARSG